MRYEKSKPPEIHRLGAQSRALPPELESLVARWLQKCGGRPMPSRSEFTSHELQPWLGQVALIESDGAEDFRISLCGVGLIRRFGREATGVGVPALARDIAEPLIAILKATGKAQAPVVALSHIALGRAVQSYCDVALPLSGPGGGIAAVLLGCHPVGKN